VSGIIQVLTRLQERVGWLSDAGLTALAVQLGLPLHRLQSVASFYTHFRRTPPSGREIHVCRDLSCWLAGGPAARDRLREALAGRDVEILEVSCLGRCDRAPAAAIDGQPVGIRSPHDALARLDDAAAAPSPGPRSWGAAEVYADPTERYSTLREALTRDPSEAAATLERAGLRGMGGAGFPTGRKWSLVAAERATPRYVICNADESEPGTFKDREVLADLPHLVIEGMALAAHCVGARRGWVFIRHEYEPERAAVEAAIDDARRRGALGEGIFGSDFDFDVEIFTSPGGYILGEETALLECMEGRRGEPRNKPPFPGRHGLWGQPTLINNVETFAHATAIVHHGDAWWHTLGREGFSGHKFVGVSGDVREPGVHLVPFGILLSELLERCGGMREGAALAAVAPGGASSRFLGPAALGVPLDFDALSEAGSMLGSGAVVFVAAGRDLVEAGLNVTRFFRDESCGKCVPCRVGTEKAVQMVEAAGRVDGGLRDELRSLDEALARTSICGLGQVALSPLRSILDTLVTLEATDGPEATDGA